MSSTEQCPDCDWPDRKLPANTSSEPDCQHPWHTSPSSVPAEPEKSMINDLEKLSKHLHDTTPERLAEQEIEQNAEAIAAALERGETYILQSVPMVISRASVPAEGYERRIQELERGLSLYKRAHEHLMEVMGLEKDELQVPRAAQKWQEAERRIQELEAKLKRTT